MTTEAATVTIVGGGVHGVHLATRLLDTGIVEHSELRIIDPNGLLGGFRQKCRQCGIRELRSPLVHHVSSDPFCLRDFARARGREDELIASDIGAERPTVSLFFDHADWVCDQYGLESVHMDAAATTLVDNGEYVDVVTTAGQFTTEWCLLAIGNGTAYSYPKWARELSATAPVIHVWEPGFDLESIGETAAVGIVGGGITAGQLATALAQPGRTVTLFARSPFRVESLEASTDWMHFSGVVDDLHDLPPASRARARTVADARYDGTIPPHVFRRLRRALDRESLTLEQTEITVATEAGGTVVITCRDGTAKCLDTIICATGFDSPYEGSLFRRLRSESSLQTGYRGAPVLDDESLQWVREDGTRSRVVVSGVAAQHVLGPFARNIIGARRAGDRIVETLEGELAATTRESVRV
ncbi:FAD/NAD(P)-binding protein [Natronorubrum sp. A-ect3]|uniref:FAD/NAD(P)-binding protein n=1 Tax=Natronorubrum sp. A-ect3 TaxID=3242698 RepID=UPI00359DCB7A